VLDVAAGSKHTVLVAEDGRAAAFGQDTRGCLGQGESGSGRRFLLPRIMHWVSRGHHQGGAVRRRTKPHRAAHGGRARADPRGRRARAARARRGRAGRRVPLELRASSRGRPGRLARGGRRVRDAAHAVRHGERFGVRLGRERGWQLGQGDFLDRSAPARVRHEEWNGDDARADGERVRGFGSRAFSCFRASGAFARPASWRERAVHPARRGEPRVRAADGVAAGDSGSAPRGAAGHTPRGGERGGAPRRRRLGAFAAEEVPRRGRGGRRRALCGAHRVGARVHVRRERPRAARARERFTSRRVTKKRLGKKRPRFRLGSDARARHARVLRRRALCDPDRARARVRVGRERSRAVRRRRLRDGQTRADALRPRVFPRGGAASRRDGNSTASRDTPCSA
jgi:hypothetical protein